MRPLKKIIDIQALRSNYQYLQQEARSAQLISVVKANAYGHSMDLIAQNLLDFSPIFAVSCIEEAMQLRDCGINNPVILLEGVFTADEIALCRCFSFMPVIHNFAQLEYLRQDRSSSQGDLAFWLSGCERAEFAEVVIVPGSIRSIGRQAFSCTGIGYIVLQEGLEKIGDLAFEGHSQIRMNIPDSVHEMGINPFADHIDLGYVNGYLFPSFSNNPYFEIDYDTGHLLYAKEDMRVITYRSNLQLQWNYSTICTVPDGIKVIGKCAFYAAPYLTEVVLPDSLQTIEAEAFLCCYELNQVIIPEGVTTIGDFAFAETAVIELEIPSSVVDIGEGIFHDWAPEEAVIRCDRGSVAEEYAVTNGYQIQYR